MPQAPTLGVKKVRTIPSHHTLDRREPKVEAVDTVVSGAFITMLAVLRAKVKT